MSESTKTLVNMKGFGDRVPISMLDFEVLREVTEELIPFNKWLGMKVEHIERGRLTVSIPWRAELIGDPMIPAMHGGIIGAVADAAGGIAVWTTIENLTTRLSTVDLRVDYLRPGKPEKLIAAATVIRSGARLGWADIRLYHPGRESDPVASARGVYAFKGPKHARPEG